ncbi:hypothetical protein M8C21_015774, partial [Ambrosia artemisiifolia]
FVSQPNLWSGSGVRLERYKETGVEPRYAAYKMLAASADAASLAVFFRTSSSFCSVVAWWMVAVAVTGKGSTAMVRIKEDTRRLATMREIQFSNVYR